MRRIIEGGLRTFSPALPLGYLAILGIIAPITKRVKVDTAKYSTMCLSGEIYQEPTPPLIPSGKSLQRTSSPPFTPLKHTSFPVTSSGEGGSDNNEGLTDFRNDPAEDKNEAILSADATAEIPAGEGASLIRTGDGDQSKVALLSFLATAVLSNPSSLQASG